MQKKLVTINQPAYFPWLGYFHRLAVSNIHIVLDDVQFEKNSFTNRNKIKVGDAASWLTVPVSTKGKFGDLKIFELGVVNTTPWARKHLQAIKLNYSRAPYFALYYPFLEQYLSREWASFNDLCRGLLNYWMEALGIKTSIVYSSDLRAWGRKDELVLDLCHRTGADIYYSGALGRNYLREEIFSAAGIKVHYQEYSHPVYPQRGAAFISHLAIVDLLMNCGESSLAVLMQGNLSQAQLKELV